MFGWKDAVWMFVGLAFIGLIGVSVWFSLESLFKTLSVLDKGVMAALITGVLIAFGAIFVKHIEHRHSVEAQFRNDKVAMYNELFGWFMKLTESEERSEQELAEALREWKRKILFWGGPKVIRHFISLSQIPSEIQTIKDLATSTQVLGNLLLAMRKDVGLSNRRIISTERGIDRATAFGARYILRNDALFFECLRKNPNMTTQEFSALEKSNSQVTRVPVSPS